MDEYSVIKPVVVETFNFVVFHRIDIVKTVLL